MKRREFIINSCTACLAVTGIASLLPSCKPTQFIQAKFNNDGLLVNTSEFEMKSNGRTAYRSYIIVSNNELKYPIFLYRINENEYSALWMQCSHQGAELQASGNYLQCPAHGSEFDIKGNVISGPAGIPLRSFPVTIQNRQLFIDLRKK